MNTVNDIEMEYDIDVSDSNTNDSFDADSEVDLVVSVNGHYGVLDWRGFHPSPEPSFQEEVRRDPVAAMSNRLARAKKLEIKGCKKRAEQLKKEAKMISCFISAKSRTQEEQAHISKPRFEHLIL